MQSCTCQEWVVELSKTSDLGRGPECRRDSLGAGQAFPRQRGGEEGCMWRCVSGLSPLMLLYYLLGCEIPSWEWKVELKGFKMVSLWQLVTIVGDWVRQIFRAVQTVTMTWWWQTFSWRNTWPAVGGGAGSQGAGVYTQWSELTYVTKAIGTFLDNFFPFSIKHLHEGSARVRTHF